MQRFVRSGCENHGYGRIFDLLLRASSRLKKVIMRNRTKPSESLNVDASRTSRITTKIVRYIFCVMLAFPAVAYFPFSNRFMEKVRTETVFTPAKSNAKSCFHYKIPALEKTPFWFNKSLNQRNALLHFKNVISTRLFVMKTLYPIRESLQISIFQHSTEDNRGEPDVRLFIS